MSEYSETLLYALSSEISPNKPDRARGNAHPYPHTPTPLGTRPRGILAPNLAILSSIKEREMPKKTEIYPFRGDFGSLNGLGEVMNQC